MKFLNAQQLAFILSISVQEAREKMVFAHCKSKGIDPPAKRSKEDFEEPKTPLEKKKQREYMIYSEYPLAMTIELVSEQLNIPTLQQSVDDIEKNYLNRPATKKWILCDLPEKQIKKCTEDGKPQKISIPAALKSMLPREVKDAITQEWQKRFPKAKVSM